MNKKDLAIFLLETHANEWGLVSNEEKSDFIIYEKNTAIQLGRGKTLVESILNAKKNIEARIYDKRPKPPPVPQERKEALIKSFFKKA